MTNGRNYKYIDAQAIHEADLPDTDEDPVEVLYESLLDVLQLAEAEGMYPEEIDLVLRRILAVRGNPQNGLPDG